ncbi:related to TAF9 - TFIID and SAGA subunit [Ustilago sp. UG-2017a]|nr:related to TAF9 - TFIID and SAGA subunit [Ustilago sp. UG-2017a]
MARSTTASTSDTGLRGPIPRDARLIALILSSMGLSDVEPSVLLQLLEFAHRYTHDVLCDALVYSDHANSRQASSSLSLDDINLAIQSRVNYSFTQPPEKDMLLGLASAVNSIPLPPISDRHGVRLPPQNQCLTNVNFRVVPNALPEGYDDFEETQATAGGEAGGASQGTNESTQNSALFDSNTRREQQGVRGGAGDDYDDDEDGEGEDGDVSMTTVHPSQSHSQSTGGLGTQEGSKQQDGQGAGDEASRGVKRSLDEDEEYD